MNVHEYVQLPLFLIFFQSFVVVLRVSISKLNVSAIAEYYSIKCTATVDGTSSTIPMVDWHWTIDDMERPSVTGDDNVTALSASSNLEFNPLRLAHVGNYTCVGFHAPTQVTTTQTIKLEVQGKLHETICRN